MEKKEGDLREKRGLDKSFQKGYGGCGRRCSARGVLRGRGRVRGTSCPRNLSCRGGPVCPPFYRECLGFRGWLTWGSDLTGCSIGRKGVGSGPLSIEHPVGADLCVRPSIANAQVPGDGLVWGPSSTRCSIGRKAGPVGPVPRPGHWEGKCPAFGRRADTQVRPYSPSP